MKERPKDAGCDTCFYVIKKRMFVCQIGKKADVYDCRAGRTITEKQFQGDCNAYLRGIRPRIKDFFRGESR